MKTLTIKSKNFDKSLESLLNKRRAKIKSGSLSP